MAKGTKTKKKTTAGRRAQLIKQFVKAVAPTPAEKREQQAEAERQQRADIKALARAYHAEKDNEKKLEEKHERKQAGNPFYCGPNDVVNRSKQGLAFLQAISVSDADDLTEDAKMGMYWMFTGIRDALQAREELDGASGSHYAEALAYAASGLDIAAHPVYRDVLKTARTQADNEVRHG